MPLGGVEPSSRTSVTGANGANGANATTTYDDYGRPTTSKIPDGATTNYTYTYNPNTQKAELGGRWSKTTLDGFGRPVKVETGNGGTTVSVAETKYAPCGCSPLGKIWQTARPYAPGATPQWTTYTYDGGGRTTAITLPDGSVSRTEFWANTVKTMDAAGKWKKQTTDAFGNLKVVTEPNPAGGADWTTSYTYDVVNHLTRVEMPRPYNGGTYTQVRTFGWSFRALPGFWGPGDKMTWETNPETGTIQYQYDGNGRLSARIDAKNRKREYSYDAYGRVTQKRDYNPTAYSWEEDERQRVEFRYDVNPLDPGYTQNAWGRLAAVEFRPQGANEPEAFSYQYSYNQAGRVTNQRMRILPDGYQPGGAVTAVNLEASYAWDNEGRMTSLTGPDNGPVESYTYDAMGRLSSGGATYGPAGELVTFNGVTRLYNALGQVTRMTKAGVMDMEYQYPTQNNGRIQKSIDHVTGEEVTYQYDALNRLSRAETTDATWGNSYTYDGWGNLTGKSVTKGTAPTLSVSYDPSLNMAVGSNPPSYWYWGMQGVYDAEDRPLNGKSQVWGTPWPYTGKVAYDHTGKKMFWGGTVDKDEQQIRGCEVYFYGITGQKLARWRCEYSPTEQGGEDRVFRMWLVDRTQHIGGQVTSWNGGGATTDRLGSLRARGGERYTYYPYGEARTETVSGGGMYAGLESPLREYLPTTGRFDRPDPVGLGAVKMGDPGSWNRFAYVQGDPVNFRDPKGLTKEYPEFCDLNPNHRYCNPYGYWPEIDVPMPEEPPPVVGGGSTSGTGIINISNLSTTSAEAVYVQNQLRWVREVLHDDATCDNWLKANNPGMSNDATIAWMLGESPSSTMRVGVGNFSDRGVNAVAGTAGTNLASGSMSITMNINGGFFKANGTTQYGTTIQAGTFEGQIFILLHELAHGSGAPNFRDKDNNPADQEWNNRLILENCGATMRRAAGGYR